MTQQAFACSSSSSGQKKMRNHFKTLDYIAYNGTEYPAPGCPLILAFSSNIIHIRSWQGIYEWDNQWTFFYVHLPLNFISFDIAQDLMKWSPVRKKGDTRTDGTEWGKRFVCVCYKDAIYQHFDAATTTTASRQKKSKRIKIDVALFSILNEKMMPQLFGCNIL